MTITTIKERVTKTGETYDEGVDKEVVLKVDHNGESKAEIEKAIRDKFEYNTYTSIQCGCAHDCCGCAVIYVFKPRATSKLHYWIITIHSTINV